MEASEPTSFAEARRTALVVLRSRVEVSSLVLALLSLALLAAFLAAPYLPMVDLPQHAAQISIWLHAGEAPFLGAEHFTLNLRTPYLAAYLLARWLAPWLGVLLALKLVVWLSVALHVVAFAVLVRRLGYPHWLELLGLPLALGYSFYFGFISFNFAVPFVLLSIAAALQHRERGTWRTGLALAALLSATLASHGFAFGVGLALVGPLLLRGAGNVMVRLLPLTVPVLIALVWLVPGPSIQSIGATIWDPRVRELVQVPTVLVGVSSHDHPAVIVGVCLLALVGLTLGRPRRELEMWAPLVLVLGGFCLFPRMQSGFGPLHPRFAAFLVPALFVAFRARQTPLSRVLPELAVGLCLGWFATFAVRLRHFAEETRAVTALIAGLPAGLRVRPVVFERVSQAFDGLPALLHLSAYYAAEKGGFQGYSFAMYPTSVVRYTESAPQGMFGGAEWQPERFSATDELPLYDVFWVKSRSDRGRQLFGDRRGEVSLVFHQQDFWAYRR